MKPYGADSFFIGGHFAVLSKNASPPQKVAELSPGMKVDAFTAVNLEGAPLTISYDVTNKPTVFYVISPSCIWCKRNQANIDKLADTKGNDFRFIDSR